MSESIIMLNSSSLSTAGRWIATRPHFILRSVITMNVEHTDLSRTKPDLPDIVRCWKETKQIVSRKIDKLNEKSEKIRKTNPAGAAILRKRAADLRSELDRMNSEAKHGASTAKLRRSEVLTRYAMVLDKARYE